MILTPLGGPAQTFDGLTRLWKLDTMQLVEQVNAYAASFSDQDGLFKLSTRLDVTIGAGAAYIATVGPLLPGVYCALCHALEFWG